MNRQAVAALVIEIAAGVAAQTSGIGGVGVTAGAAATAIATSAYLTIDARRLPLSERIRRFAVQRRATQPPSDEQRAHEEHSLDTLECFEQRFGSAVSATLQRLRKSAALGKREEQRLGSPKSIGDIENLARYLKELGY
jgi:hypothetical protein